MALTKVRKQVIGTDQLIPIGVVAPFTGHALSNSWLMCDGSAVSRTTYPSLFAIVGTTYGVGDGSTTFNLPDMRGRAVVGKDDMGGVAAGRITAGWGITLGGNAGAETHTLTTNEIPSHTHTHKRKYVTGGTTLGGDPNNLNSYTDTSGSTGGGAAHNNVQPSLAVIYMIKAL
jgi:microcystin-dependent protein